MTKVASAAQWVDSPWLGFDTETTGIVPANDRLVTAAAVARLGGLTAVDPDQSEVWLANPQVEIPAFATAVHGISTEYAREHGADPAQTLEEINQRLAAQLKANWPVVIFNAGFDLPLVEADSLRNNVEPLSRRVTTVSPIIDPLVLDRALMKYRRGKRTLSALCVAYEVEVPENTHQADVDSHITLNLLAKMLEKFPALQEMSAEELHQFQINEHLKWAEDFERFLHSKGRSQTISRIWF